MASQPSTPEAGIESARSLLSAALTGVSPAVSAPPAAPPAPVPAPWVAPPATPPTEPAPSTVPSAFPAGLVPNPFTSPAPPAESTPPAQGSPVPSQFTDPAAQRYLAMKGGNVEKALADAAAYNNRLSALQAAHPEMFLPGGPADPNGPAARDLTFPSFVDPATVAPEGQPGTAPTPTPPVAPEIPINWEQINAETDRVATQVDDVCRGYTKTWVENDRAIQQAAKEVGEKQSRLSYINGLLSDQTIELGELKLEEFKDEGRTLKSDIGMLRQDAMMRVLHNDRLDQAFRNRRAQIFDHLSTTYRTQAQEQALNSELQSIEASEYQRLSSAWPGAVARTVAAARIPADLAADFDTYARQMANASLANPNFEVQDVDAFMSGVAKGYVERLDRYHRAQAATYGSLAAQRAASPSPSAGPGYAAPPPVNPSNISPEAAIDDANRYLRQRMRG